MSNHAQKQDASKNSDVFCLSFKSIEVYVTYQLQQICCSFLTGWKREQHWVMDLGRVAQKERPSSGSEDSLCFCSLMFERNGETQFTMSKSF